MIPVTSGVRPVPRSFCGSGLEMMTLRGSLDVVSAGSRSQEERTGENRDDCPCQKGQRSMLYQHYEYAENASYYHEHAHCLDVSNCNVDFVHHLPLGCLGSQQPFLLNTGPDYHFPLERLSFTAARTSSLNAASSILSLS